MAKTESEILIVRMRSGEDVIAQTTKTATGYHLKSPAMLVPTGKGGLGLMPWLMYAEISNGVDIPAEATFFHVRPLKGLEEEYYSGFISKLVTPSKSISTPSMKLVTD